MSDSTLTETYACPLSGSPALFLPCWWCGSSCLVEDDDPGDRPWVRCPGPGGRCRRRESSRVDRDELRV